LLHEFHHQHSFPLPENSCHQLTRKQHLFKLFQFVLWMCVHQLLWLLFGFSIRKWNIGCISCYSYIVTDKLIAILMVSL
jgi:hypothetical protein